MLMQKEKDVIIMVNFWNTMKDKIKEALEHIEEILSTTRRYTDVSLVKDDILKEVNNIKKLVENGN